MGDFGVAARHGHGHRFVATVNILWLLSAARRRFGEGFPYRRPFRSRRGEDEFDAASFDRFEHCLSAMHENFPPRLVGYSPTSFLPCVAGEDGGRGSRFLISARYPL